MPTTTDASTQQGTPGVLGALPDITPKLETLYRELHQHPELSMQERQTSARMADKLRALGFDVTSGVGTTGVVGVLRNGAGATVMLRADMDALPVREATGLPFASTVTATDAEGVEVPVAHACGHDMHMTWLCGAASLLARSRESWSGTLIALFQPAEETGEGAQAMIDDGLFELVPKPDVILGQHVLPPPAGQISLRAGVTQSQEDNIRVRLIGRGGHGAWPEGTVDPVVMAAAVVMRLQTIVAREIAAQQSVVVTVGSMHAGTKANVIASEAVLQINVRTFDAAMRKRVLAAIKRIVNAEAHASGAPQDPEIVNFESFPLTVNDGPTEHRVTEAFRGHFGPEAVVELAEPLIVSEDFGSFGSQWGVPSLFWYVGGTDPEAYVHALAAGREEQDIPANHSPEFAPVLHPTLEVGVQTLVLAALSYLSV